MNFILFCFANASIIASMAGFDKEFSEKTIYALMGIFPTTAGLAKSCE